MRKINEEKKEKTKEDNKDLEDLAVKLSIYLVFIVMLLKIIPSLMTGSYILFSELADSSSDILAVLITYIGVKTSQKPPDFQHMFGHRKVNSFAALFQGLIMICIYFYILYGSISRLITEGLTPLTKPEMGIGFMAIIIIIDLYFAYKIRNIGRKTHNTLIIAQSTNYVNDFYRNLTSLIGLSIASLGYYIFDYLLAWIFSIRAFYEAEKIIRQSYYELVDTNPLDEEKVEKIKRAINELEGIHLCDLRIRAIGNHMDFIVIIDLKRETSENIKKYSEFIRHYITKFFPEYVCNVIITINTEEALIEHFSMLQSELEALTDKYPSISNIHDISIDHFYSLIILQFHLDILGDLTLKKAHAIQTEFEKEAKVILRRLLKGTEFEKEEIEVYSHLEPSTTKHIVHNHEKSHTSKTLRKQIEEIARDVKGILSIKGIHAEYEGDDLTLIIVLELEASLSVWEAHKITEELEYKIMNQIHGVLSCLIHYEPHEE